MQSTPLNKTQRVFAREFKGQRYDVGDKFGFMKTSIDYALKHPQVKDDLKQYIIDLGKQLEESEKNCRLIIHKSKNTKRLAI